QAFGCRLGATAVMASAGGMHLPEDIGFGLTPSPMPTAEDCERPVAAFITNGRLDTTVPVDRGRLARDAWVEINGCDPTPNTGPAGNFIDNFCVGRPAPCVCERYECSGAPLVYCEDNGGHQYPGTHRDTAVQWFHQFQEPFAFPGSEESGEGPVADPDDDGTGG